MINILSKETIDKIAAGEVAERPESVVKELVDNALDSCPTAVSIEIKGGGTELIRVTDNGCGIERSDIPAAFIRHATSKLKTAEDIEHIATMGFRGEALASIAAVSDTEMISKCRKDLTGTLYRTVGGKEKANKEIGAPDGTTVAVRNFLFNVPVRRQFLKSPQVENSYIVTTVECMALAHPDISFSLTVDGRNVLHTSGNGRMKDIIYIIYGAETASNLIELDFKKDDIQVAGYAAKPVINRSRRDCELFFVNGRTIQSDILRKAVEDGYAPYMMQHRFPMIFLDLGLPPEKVDVNVHPRKTEVRFSDNSAVYDTVLDAVKSALCRKELISNISYSLSSKKPSMHAYSIETPKTGTAENAAPKSYSVSGQNINEHLSLSENKVLTDFKAEPFEKKRKFDYVGTVAEFAEKYNTAIAEPITEYNDSVDRDSDRAFLNRKNIPYYKMVGQVFDTYWIIECNNEMYMIDQHAAHEKVNYEHFTALIKNHEVEKQMLFPPIVLTLTAREALQVEKNAELFSEAGYEIEYAGDRDYIVRSVPSNLPGVGEYELLRDIIEHTCDESKALSSEILKDKIASMSCKAAVKGNNRLSEQEMRALIDELLVLENPYACPHGRPTIIKWSKDELDRLFKRIV